MSIEPHFHYYLNQFCIFEYEDIYSSVLGVLCLVQVLSIVWMVRKSYHKRQNMMTPELNHQTYCVFSIFQLYAAEVQLGFISAIQVYTIWMYFLGSAFNPPLKADFLSVLKAVLYMLVFSLTMIIYPL